MLPLVMSKQWLLLFVMNFFSIFLGLFIANEYKTYWLTADNHPGDRFISTVGSFGSVFNGLRFLWSFALDYLDYKYVYAILLCLQIVIAVTYHMIIEEKNLVGIWICMGYWCLGGHFTLVPNEMKKVFGKPAT